jgi:IS5 family transposase
MRAKGKTVVQQSKTKLAEAVELTEKLLDRAKLVVAGNRIIADRIVSSFDPEARSIKKGKLAKGTEVRLQG